MPRRLERGAKLSGVSAFCSRGSRGERRCTAGVMLTWNQTTVSVLSHVVNGGAASILEVYMLNGASVANYDSMPHGR
jgi:hypothetical protein